jgi:hypothetical protein
LIRLIFNWVVCTIRHIQFPRLNGYSLSYACLRASSGALCRAQPCAPRIGGEKPTDVRRARRIIVTGREQYRTYPRTKGEVKPGEELIRAAIDLAQLDLVYCIGLFDIPPIDAEKEFLSPSNSKARVAFYRDFCIP